MLPNIIIWVVRRGLMRRRVRVIMGPMVVNMLNPLKVGSIREWERSFGEILGHGEN